MERGGSREVREGPLPKFARSELTLGQLVGKGGFSLVFEIAQIAIDELYDVSKKQATHRRQVAEKFTGEDGHATYAIKMLRDDLIDEEHSKGVIDLAVEARFLRRLAHENIVSMVATANSDPLESRFFIILEMLMSTLEDKLAFWRRSINKTMSVWCGPFGYCCANKPVLNSIWMERIHVTKCIASAIQYLHNEDIIYRDLKPENIGFDREGKVKVFDFGLAKRLLPDDKTPSGMYRLTGNTGSLRYMAPEVALNQNYNLSADSYSFAIVFWQICSLTVPYAGYNVRMHSDLVVGKGYRPKVERSWPYVWSSLMATCWSTVVDERLNFDEILKILEGEYDKLVTSRNGREGDIRAKRKRPGDSKNDESSALRLDVDTRKADFFAQADECDQRRIDVDIV
jgi:serine/threonine protein kinase